MTGNKVIARLIRFYGGTVSGWERLTVGEIRDYISYIPELQAEENLNLKNVLAIGNGLMPQNEQRTLITDWYRRSGRMKNRRNTTGKQRIAVLAGMGIGVRHA